MVVVWSVTKALYYFLRGNKKVKYTFMRSPFLKLHKMWDKSLAQQHHLGSTHMQLHFFKMSFSGSFQVMSKSSLSKKNQRLFDQKLTFSKGQMKKVRKKKNTFWIEKYFKMTISKNQRKQLLMGEI